MKPERWIPALVLALVAAAIVLAFRVLGSPGHARELSLDEIRQRDLAAIAQAVHERYASRPLPVTLSGPLARRDPITHELYDYGRVDSKRYVLCATFGTGTAPDAGDGSGAQFRHGIGHTCFSLDTSKDWPDPANARF